jgi:hypothetical protein
MVKMFSDCKDTKQSLNGNLSTSKFSFRLFVGLRNSWLALPGSVSWMEARE